MLAAKATSEEDRKTERQAKLEAWKQGKAAVELEKTRHHSEVKKLDEMDVDDESNPSPSKNTNQAISPDAEALSAGHYVGKFDPKDIARKSSGTSVSKRALGSGISVPQKPHSSGIVQSTVSPSGVLTTKAGESVTSSMRLRPILRLSLTNHRLPDSGRLKARGNVSGFGLGGRSQPDSEKTLAPRGLDFGEEVSSRRKLEKLPDPTLDSVPSDDGQQEQDDDEDMNMADTEEGDAAAARAAAEKREERLTEQKHDESRGSEQCESDPKLEPSTRPVPSATGQNRMDCSKRGADNEEQDAAIDPLDAYMSGLGRSGSAAPGLADDSNGRAKRQEPQAMFGDDENDLIEDVANSQEILDMASKGKKKKKEIPPANHTKINYEPFRKNFYCEPTEFAAMSKSEVATLRAELDGIKVKGNDVPKPVQKFSQCGLGVLSQDILHKLGFEKPTPIQAQAIPLIMSGRDMTGIAKTGSGKTIAFLLPMFRHIKDQRPLETMEGPIGLIMTPTRELATQISRECKPWLKTLNLRAACVYGGAPIKDQIADLKRGAEILVCTPGRMIDLLAANSGRVTNLRRVTYAVLDEADRMFDMGFEPQVMKILSNVRPDRQTVMFSATFPKKMDALARQALSKPVDVIVGGRAVVAPEINQVVEVRSEDSKFLRLLHLLGELHQDEDARSLIFVDRQESAEELMNALLKKGYPCFTIHGGKDQFDRDSVISDFKAGIFPVLIATSVAARGLDVKQLKMVVNFDCPNHLEDYVHRAGRTGRAGNTGTAVTFITEEQGGYAIDIAKALKQSNQEVPEPVQKLVDTFSEKIKSGLAKASSHGFGGKGLEEVARKHDAAKARERKNYRTGDDELEDEKDDEEEQQQEEEDQGKKAGKKEESAFVKPDVPKPGAKLAGVPEGIDLDGQIKVHRTEKPDVSQTAPQDRMKGVSDAVAAINARLRKSGDIRGNAPIDNKGPDAGAFHATLEINDFPQKARWAVTNRTNVAKILEATGTSITTKGNYYLNIKPTPNDPPKLYILVEGDTEIAVKNAMRELMRLLKDATAAAVDSESRAPTSGRYSVL